MDYKALKTNLEKNGFKVTCFETSKAAKEYLTKEIKDTTVSFGGSITLQDMGLYESLSKNNEVFWHWNIPEGKTAKDMIDASKNTDIYISSANGIAQSGEIINIDGTGNRVAAISHGHKKVYIVAGKNKIAPDFEKALFRARNIAAPLNAKRLARKTPCAQNADKCYNCSSPERICRNLSVLYIKPSGAEYEVVLVNENMGY